MCINCIDNICTNRCVAIDSPDCFRSNLTLSEEPSSDRTEGREEKADEGILIKVKNLTR